MEATKLIQELSKHISVFGDSEVTFTTSMWSQEFDEVPASIQSVGGRTERLKYTEKSMVPKGYDDGA